MQICKHEGVENMKLSELKQMIDNTLKYNPTAADCEVTIPISGEGGIGARPSVKVRSAGKGIDWDSWQFMLHAEVPLYKKPPKERK